MTQSGGKTLLHIRTIQATHDPVAQFVLAYDCGSRLQREYVVLLDPPSRITPAILAAESPFDSPEKAPATQGVSPPRAAPVPHRRTQPRVTRRPPTTAAAHAAASRQPAADTPSPTATDSPRLVLSGKRSGILDGALALQFDTNLPDMNRKLPEGLTPTELSDEYTALTHKLAHLETQLAELQQKNAALEANKGGAASKAAPTASDKPAQWPTYLLMIGLLAGAGALIVWLRQRSRDHQANAHLDKDWPPTIASAMPVADPMEADPWEAPPSLKIEKPAAPPRRAENEPSAPQRMSEIAPPPLNQSTEVKDDILDQAEVYMAHGHGELAIHLLQEHLRAAPAESPVPWLLLLDLLHRNGDTTGYAAASAECRRHFNINLTGHPISQDSDSGMGLEAYPHLLDQLVTVWGTPNTDDFFRDLLYDNRGGTRVGFDPRAYRDILMLRTIAQNVQPLSLAG